MAPQIFQCPVVRGIEGRSKTSSEAESRASETSLEISKTGRPAASLAGFAHEIFGAGNDESFRSASIKKSPTRAIEQGGPDIALDVWVAEQQEGLTGSSRNSDSVGGAAAPVDRVVQRQSVRPTPMLADGSCPRLSASLARWRNLRTTRRM